jgi:hypothetical protein
MKLKRIGATPIFRSDVRRRFRNHVLRRLYEDNDRREVNPEHADKITRMLTRLDEATRWNRTNCRGMLLPVTGASPFVPIDGSSSALTEETRRMLSRSINTRVEGGETVSTKKSAPPRPSARLHRTATAIAVM